MKYAKSTNGFYDTDIHAVVPDDAVEITPSEHAALLAAQSSGKIIQSDATGYPVAVDLPPPSAAEVAAKTRADRIAQTKLELAILDGKKIRPLAEGDAAYLATLNAQTATLRAELAVL